MVEKLELKKWKYNKHNLINLITKNQRYHKITNMYKYNFILCK